MLARCFRVLRQVAGCIEFVDNALPAQQYAEDTKAIQDHSTELSGGAA